MEKGSVLSNNALWGGLEAYQRWNDIYLFLRGGGVE